MGTLTSVAALPAGDGAVALAYVKRSVTPPAPAVLALGRRRCPCATRGVAPRIVTRVRRPVLASLLVVVVVAVASGCTNTKEEALPPVPPTVSSTTTTLIDYSTVPLASVAGKTTTTVNQGPGHARLVGKVVGPDGPVPGAIVRVERLQEGSVVFRGDVVTDPEGKWQTGQLVGGRWRVRAWRAPDLADVQPDTVFLESTQTRGLTLPLDRFDAPVVAAAIAPDPPPVAEPVNLVVAVTRKLVDAEGIVHQAPVPLLVVQLFAPNWLIESDNPRFTDGEGRVTWLVACVKAGPSGMFVALRGVGLRPVTVTACGVPPPPPPATAPPG